MKAQEILDEALGPDELKIVSRAFNEAWEVIKHDCSSPESVEAARIGLAGAVLAAHRNGVVDVELIKQHALSVVRP